jgi:hypothetical protein
METTAVLSDAHGNLPALKAVIHDAYNAGASEFWYLGDAVGYLPYPYQVWDELQCLNIQPEAWLAGNHEWGLLGKLERRKLKIGDGEYTLPLYSYIAWPILQLQREALANQQTMLAHLSALPVMSSPRRGIYLGHGAFCEDETISLIREVKNPSLSKANLDKLMQQEWPVRYASGAGGIPRLLALGHTHLPGIWFAHLEDQDFRWRPFKNLYWQPSEIVNTPILLNPGSVGLSRDGDGCASYALIKWLSDDNIGSIEIRRIWYDQSQLRELMEQTEEYQTLLHSGYWFECQCLRKGE